MELVDFDSDALYFDRPLTPELEGLLMQSASAWGTAEAELYLLRAFLLAPENLRVLVVLYRHYYRAGRLAEAASAADRLLSAAGEELGFPPDWRLLEKRHLQNGLHHSIGLVRFYLIALKARAALGLRLKQVEAAREMLVKVRELDGADRLGSAALIAIVDNRCAPAAGGVS
jgi:hypothetical protein